MSSDRQPKYRQEIQQFLGLLLLLLRGLEVELQGLWFQSHGALFACVNCNILHIGTGSESPATFLDMNCEAAGAGFVLNAHEVEWKVSGSES
ncbi:hypothetical protein N7454_004045 [Penicillium verhagenii]|nr:hypothetical protein N7454_004045 [Penicillium verhagenii]